MEEDLGQVLKHKVTGETRNQTSNEISIESSREPLQNIPVGEITEGILGEIQ